MNVSTVTTATANLSEEYDSEWDVYWYEKNLQGDIVAVYDEMGVKLVSYVYDAYGNATVTYHNGGASTTVVNNPFRYRGYYYDIDLGMYYLQTRYYDPVIGRFISPDSYASTGTGILGCNMYAYCENNPVMYSDPSGKLGVTIGAMAIGALIGASISAISSAFIQKALTGTVNWASVGVAAASGAISGAIAASPLGIVEQGIAGGVIGGLSYIADCYVNDETMYLDSALLSVGLGVASGIIGGPGANNNKALSNTAKNAKQTIARENRRTNQKYAEKVIARTVSNRNNTYALTTWNSSFKFSAALGLSNGTTTVYSQLELFPDMPSWKP